VICCAAPPEGGRMPLTQRFTRHFHVLCIPQTSEEAMAQIFRTILEGFFTSHKFKPDVISLGSSVVAGTITIYDRIIKELLPTPDRTHYTFNLRDVSKVIQGITMVDSRIVSNPDSVIKLWIHELSRVFHDRLINRDDRRWFTDAVVKVLMQVFRKDWTHEEVFE
jgi:dynein heavy chain